MGIKFHDGTLVIYQNYSGGRAWNDPYLLGNVPAKLRQYNSEKEMRTFLAKLSDETMKAMVGGKFSELLKSEDLNVWVVKGLHDAGNGFVLVPHVTLGWDGYLWHVEFLDDSKKGLVATSVTRGQQATAVDADGFRKVT